MIDYKQEIENCSNWIKDYVKKSGAKGVVIGISGGIDSAIITCICLKALGKENIIPLYLPCYSRNDMEIDAKKLAENLDITLITKSIITIYNETLNILGFKETDDNYNMVQANLKARIRMNILYSYANKYNYLVAGTGNKTELMIGFYTKFGDGGTDFESIGNYYKYEVYKMAKFFPEIPKQIISKAPTADLYNGQTDEEEIGIKYSEIDEILEAIETGDNKKLDRLDINKINKIQKMMKSAVHKNNIPPRYERN